MNVCLMFKSTLSVAVLFITCSIYAQQIIPLDTTHWQVNAKAYIFENYEGNDAIYIQQGLATLKDTTFINGTIEFDVYLTNRQCFPGVRFRMQEGGNMESFFLRPHLSGKPDANQAAPVINGLTAWQLYFGPTYSFTYNYNFESWTHIKLVINDKRAQVYLDYADTPNLSWTLKHEPKSGSIAIGGSFAPIHYANFKVDKRSKTIENFSQTLPEKQEGIIPRWTVLDKFDESLLDDPANLESVLGDRTWKDQVEVEENNAANLSWVATRYGSPGNTVFARIDVISDKDQVKLVEFGYSDRVVVILNDEAIYSGTNKWRTRDYRYLGTVGLFDAVYLNLKKGKNTLLFAVSEDFGGWGVTAKFKDNQGITIQNP